MSEGYMLFTFSAEKVAKLLRSGESPVKELEAEPAALAAVLLKPDAYRLGTVEGRALSRVLRAIDDGCERIRGDEVDERLDDEEARAERYARHGFTCQSMENDLSMDDIQELLSEHPRLEEDSTAILPRLIAEEQALSPAMVERLVADLRALLKRKLSKDQKGVIREYLLPPVEACAATGEWVFCVSSLGPTPPEVAPTGDDPRLVAQVEHAEKNPWEERVDARGNARGYARDDGAHAAERLGDLARKAGRTEDAKSWRKREKKLRTLSTEGSPAGQALLRAEAVLAQAAAAPAAPKPVKSEAERREALQASASQFEAMGFAIEWAAGRSSFVATPSAEQAESGVKALTFSLDDV